MAATVEAVYGLLHEMKNGMDKMASNASAHKVPRSTGRKRPHEEVDTNVDHPAGEIEEEASPRKLFNDQFRRSTTGYSSAGLANLSTETFLYDWYSKDLGTVGKNNVILKMSHWCLTVGSKASNDNVGDAKSMMKLLQCLMSEEQLTDITTAPPNAASDSGYSQWEMRVRGIAKTVTKLANDFLILKEGKVGNAKTLSVGAMARRWKMLKYIQPSPEDLTELTKASESSKSSSSSSVRKSKSKSKLRKGSNAGVVV